MKLTSPAFKNNGFIPERFTCNKGNISPELSLENIPELTKTLALIVDDPDAPSGDWVHWVVYNIPVVKRIEEGSIPGVLGKNDFGEQGYTGPCPPSGTHRYFFKAYALDISLDLEGKADKKTLEKAMQGHILGKAELVGLYENKP